MKNLNNIPFIGIVAENGYVESYDYITAEEWDFHHSYVLSKEGITYYNSPNTLRFVRYSNSNIYTLEGSPSLDPFNKGFDQIKIFVNHVLVNGADPEIEIKVLDHELGTEYDGKKLGRLKNWI